MEVFAHSHDAKPQNDFGGAVNDADVSGANEETAQPEKRRKPAYQSYRSIERIKGLRTLWDHVKGSRYSCRSAAAGPERIY
jgi:hypothetical protein